MSRLGDTIRTARLASKMTEKALGKKCGMAESVIKDIESGRRIVTDDQAQRILKLLGVKNPISTELEVASEPEVKLRPRPRPYVIPVPEEKAEKKSPEEEKASGEASDAWLDALGGVVKRVPVMDETGLVIDHVLTPIIGGRIEGGQPDKVIYFRMPDDSLRGNRIYAGDLLLTVPASAPINEAVMLLVLNGHRLMRKVTKLDGAKLLLQSYDREFNAQTVPLKDVLIIGRAVKLYRNL